MKKDELYEYTGEVFLPVFEYKIYVIFTSNVHLSVKNRQNDDNFPQLRDDQIPFHTDGGCHIYNKHNGYAYIFLHDKAGVSVPVHESYHAICRLFRYVDANTPYDEEMFAYHQDHLVTEMCRIQEEMFNSRKKKKTLDKRKKTR